MPETRPHSLEEAFSSSGRIRILTLLSHVEQLHLTEISKRIDQSYAATDRHLTALHRADLVEERDYGRVRMFRLRLENPRAKMLHDLILRWDKSQAIDDGAQA